MESLTATVMSKLKVFFFFYWRHTCHNDPFCIAWPQRCFNQNLPTAVYNTDRLTQREVWSNWHNSVDVKLCRTLCNLGLSSLLWCLIVTAQCYEFKSFARYCPNRSKCVCRSMPWRYHSSSIVMGGLIKYEWNRILFWPQLHFLITN